MATALRSVMRHRACFILSAGRSGSKMLARVLALHPELGAFHEPLPLLNTEAFLRWSGRRDGAWVARRLAKKRDRLIEEVSANQLLYVESSHFLSHLVPELFARYDCRFIHLYRDGRHFVRSGLERDWYGPSRWRSRFHDALRRRTGREIGNSYRDHRLSPPRGLETRLEAIAWLWTEINRTIVGHLDVIPADRRLAFKVEEFGPEAIRRVLDLLQVEASDDLVSRMSSCADGLPNRTANRSHPRPEDWTGEEQSRFDAIAGEVMERLGYERG